MISLSQACSIALRFYEEKIHVHGLAAVRETEQFFVFSGGSNQQRSIGGVTLCVDKKDGAVSILKFPSRESTAVIRASTPVERGSTPDY